MAAAWRAFNRGIILVALAFAIICGAFDSTLARQTKRRKTGDKQDAAKAAKAAEAREQAAIRAANAQIAAAKRVLAAAESKEDGAQAKLKEAIASLREAASEFDDAQSAARRLAKELAEIEQEILDEQAADSSYAKAVAAVEESQRQLKSIEERLLGEKENHDALSGLTGTTLAERRSAILTRSAEHVQAKAKLDAAAAAAEARRRELFRSDDDWKTTAEALTKARQKENTAEGQTRAGAGQRLDASSDLQQAKDAAAVARSAIRKAEAVIERAKANDKGKKSPPQRDNDSPRKKK